MKRVKLPIISQYNLISKLKAKNWRLLNDIPEYVNATYDGFTGVKLMRFPVFNNFKSALPDITTEFHSFEESILQELSNTLKKPFGKIRTYWKICQNFGTGESWDTKFLPEFPGRTDRGQKQFAKYQGEIVSGNDISNMLYGHVCAFMGISPKLAKFIARLDAKGFFELFAKGKIPNKTLLRFNDTASDQAIIEKSVKNFNIKNYKIK